MPSSKQWLRVAALEEFDIIRKIVRVIEGKRILLYRSGREILAVGGLCSHLDKPLDEGRIIGGQIICPFHGACFDLRSGKAMSGPAVHSLPTYPVRLEADQVFIELDSGEACQSPHIFQSRC